MAATQTSFRVLMFPWLGVAHISPFLELAKKLSKKNFHIYFCSTRIILDSIRKSLNKDSCDNDNSSIELVELHLPSLPELPPHYHTTKNIPPHLQPTLMKAFQMSSSNFSDIITNLKPDLLIYDGFQPWSAKIASSLGIPPVFFSVSGSTSMSFFHHMYTHKTRDTYPYQGIFLKGYEKRSLTAQGRTVEVKDAEKAFLFGDFQLSHQIALVKSCRGIEGKYIDYLSKLCNKRIVPAGPLVTMGDNRESADSKIMNWLSQKTQCSTIYISLGSENYFSNDQMVEIAKGLEKTSVNFIWVVRSPHGSDDFIEEAVPEGFRDRVKERGMIVTGWAPQAAILAHPNVGGYLSHCGWTSITESLYFGVPVVAMPMQSDHPFNARLVVEAGVGVEVVRDEDGRFDGEAVAKAINEVILESGEKFRCKARELSEKMKMEEDEDINEIAEELSRICLKK